MKFFLKIFILTLSFFFVMANFVDARTKEQELPILLYVVKYNEGWSGGYHEPKKELGSVSDMIRGDGAIPPIGSYHKTYKQIAPGIISYIGKIAIDKDNTIHYKDERYQTDIDYRSIVWELEYNIKDKKPCELTTYHFFKPSKIMEDDIIKKGNKNIINKSEYLTKGRWVRTTKTYYPCKDFFKCIYNKGHFIDPKVGEIYEKNGFTREQRPYELISALLADDMPAFVEGFDGKNYTIPIYIKKHINVWLKEHPEPKDNKTPVVNFEQDFR